jgi:hypothetical protein
MEHRSPHSAMIEARRIAIYIDKDSKWYPARDYQEEAVKDFLEVLNKNLMMYKQLLKDGILIPNEIKKGYIPRQCVDFNISYDITNNEPVYFINTLQLNSNDPDSLFETHLATVYHTWDSEESLSKHPVIGKIGILSDELIRICKK